MSSFFRYPGGKSKLKTHILDVLDGYVYEYQITKYIEPFFGGGSIGIEFLSQHPRIKTIQINDKDFGIVCLWTSILRYPAELKKMVMNFQPSIEAFDEFKHKLLARKDMPKQPAAVVRYGFMKLAIHQISYSGLGTKSGGPLGGRKQTSIYKIDCRWSPKYICGKIDKLHLQLAEKQVCITSADFQSLVQSADPHCLLYLDPPYFMQGNNLYQFGFTEEDHIRLSTILKITKAAWVLSYDDCKEIRKLYSWAHIKEIMTKYSITGARQKKELLICL